MILQPSECPCASPCAAGRSGSEGAIRRLWIVGALLLGVGLGFPARAQPLGMALGAFGGMGYDYEEGRPRWVGGGFVEAGPHDGVQVRIGAALIRPSDGVILRLETLMLANVHLGAWVFLGGGLGVDRAMGADGAEMRFPLFAAAGLKTRPLPGMPWRFFVEGRVSLPLPLLGPPSEPGERPLGIQFSAGALLSF